MRHRIIATALMTAALAGTTTAAHAATGHSPEPRVAAVAGVYGGKYANYRACTSAGSLAIGLGLYNGYVCDPITGSTAYRLYFQ
ncbi:hypothetical protein [Kitasatospora sp. NPDC088134]|uniref:hypothetical protein n=1 Tax=Kitasatospora sp. NPDC088134 TaxID=3364071 RepID=UPI00381C2015